MNSTDATYTTKPPYKFIEGESERPEKNEKKQVMSKEMEGYFQDLEERVRVAYDIANAARSMGVDPELTVEIPLTKDLAARVENLVGPEGIAKRIRELHEIIGNREEVAIHLAKELISTLDGPPDEIIDQAVRTCLAVLTEGVLVAPMEGISKVKIKTNQDGTPFVALYFAGPIRSAGGTGQAMSVLIADVARRELGIDRYKASDKAVERLKEEIQLYRRVQHLQITPSNEEIETIVRNCPISIDGEPTEKAEISGNRDIPDFDTNRVRGGACLVISEGMCLKAPKLLKHVEKLEIPGWDFLKQLTRSKDRGKGLGIEPNFKYIKDLIAGRPVFSYPSEKGGFRLRYGRARTAGTAALAVHPAALTVTGDFLAIGTQIKIERPGKAAAITPCDSIEGPMVVLDNGDFIRLDSRQEAERVKKQIIRVPDLGEILVPYGEFSENNHLLMPGAFAPEWWSQEVEAKGISSRGFRNAEEAFSFSREHDVPLSPYYNLFWHDLTVADARELRDHIKSYASYTWEEKEGIEVDVLKIKNIPGIKKLLEDLGVLHTVEAGNLRVTQYAYPLIKGIGLDLSLNEVSDPDIDDIIDWVSMNSGITVKARGATRIGTRMGRPEKAKERTMKPPLHALYPIGNAGTNQRLINKAALKGPVNVDVGSRYCPTCEIETHRLRCYCGTRSHDRHKTSKMNIDVAMELNHSKKVLGLNQINQVKGVKGMMSKDKYPEILEKGVLRALKEVYVYKDGTLRVDITDLPLTHFKPREIDTPVVRLRELGYKKDIYGKPLEREDQILELKVQDVVPAQSVADYFVQAASFVDDELRMIYNLPPYYKVRTRADLIGHLVIGLAPHTSAGVLARIIGFTKASVCYAHPFFHTAKRRNCDGDEDALLLLMDGLLNFSRKFIPDRLGGLMDAPLVLSTRIDPSEIDKEAHNLDVRFSYPLEFYHAAEKYIHPKELEDIMDTVGSRIGNPDQYENFGFTHDTHDINDGPPISIYKTLGSMIQKLQAEFRIVHQLVGVDERDMARRVIESHFLPDIIGNMNSFSRQSFRCVLCNTIYRRIPLKTECTKRNYRGDKCGGKLVLTVYENSVKKYLNSTIDLAEKYQVPLYTVQRIQLMKKAVRSLFDSDKFTHTTIFDFYEE